MSELGIFAGKDGVDIASREGGEDEGQRKGRRIIYSLAYKELKELGCRAFEPPQEQASMRRASEFVSTGVFRDMYAIFMLEAEK